MSNNKSSTFLGKAYFFSYDGPSSRGFAGFKVFRDRHSSEDAHDGHHDHQFDQGEGILLLPSATEAIEKGKLGTGLHGQRKLGSTHSM